MDIIKSIEHEQMKNKIPYLKVGDTVKVKGTTSEFALAKQFGSGIEVTKTGEGTVTHPVAKELDGAKLDEYANATEAKVEYITFTGTLAAPDRYYNVTVEGASNVIGSITYPLNADEIKALNGTIERQEFLYNDFIVDTNVQTRCDRYINQHKIGELSGNGIYITVNAG